MVKRYDISMGPGEICMSEESWGEYVAYEDYTALLSECAEHKSNAMSAEYREAELQKLLDGQSSEISRLRYALTEVQNRAALNGEDVSFTIAGKALAINRPTASEGQPGIDYPIGDGTTDNTEYFQKQVDSEELPLSTDELHSYGLKVDDDRPSEEIIRELRKHDTDSEGRCEHNSTTTSYRSGITECDECGELLTESIEK